MNPLHKEHKPIKEHSIQPKPDKKSSSPDMSHVTDYLDSLSPEEKHHAYSHLSAIMNKGGNSEGEESINAEPKMEDFHKAMKGED